MGISIRTYLRLDIDSMGSIPGAGAKWTMATNEEDRAGRGGDITKGSRRDASRALANGAFFIYIFSLLNDNLDYAQLRIPNSKDDEEQPPPAANSNNSLPLSTHPPTQTTSTTTSTRR